MFALAKTPQLQAQIDKEEIDPRFDQDLDKLTDKQLEYIVRERAESLCASHHRSISLGVGLPNALFFLSIDITPQVPFAWLLWRKAGVLITICVSTVSPICVSWMTVSSLKSSAVIQYVLKIE